MTDKTESPEVARRPLVIPLDEADHERLSEIGRKYGLQKATYARLVILTALVQPERFEPALAPRGE